MMVEYKLPIITVNPDGSLRGKGGLLEDEAVEFAGIDMIQVAQANHTGNMGIQFLLWVLFLITGLYVLVKK